jgi:hypothetical protein
LCRSESLAPTYIDADLPESDTRKLRDVFYYEMTSAEPSEAEDASPAGGFQPGIL